MIIGSDTRAGVTRGLRALADLLDAHPDLPLPHHTGGTIQIYTFGADEFATAARALGGSKQPAHDGRLTLVSDLHGLRVTVTDLSGEVCERVVVGQTVEEVPDPEVVCAAQALFDAAVAAAARVEVHRDVTEWRCADSILRPREAVEVSA